MRDIVVTWPQTRTLESYLGELDKAVEHGLHINYRVPRLPQWEDAIEDHGWVGWPHGVEHPRCFMVHSGFVRGWCGIVGAGWRPGGRVLDPVTGGFMRAGWYIVRSPEFHAIKPMPMQGFRGWRWFDPEGILDAERLICLDTEADRSVSPITKESYGKSARGD